MTAMIHGCRITSSAPYWDELEEHVTEMAYQAAEDRAEKGQRLRRLGATTQFGRYVPDPCGGERHDAGQECDCVIFEETPLAEAQYVHLFVEVEAK